MPEITLQHDIHTDEDTFWNKVFFEESFNRGLFETELKFPSYKIVELKDDAAKVVRSVQVSPPTGDLPGPMKKAIGDRFSYTEDGTFDKAAKKYSFKIIPSALADKTKISGEIWVEPTAESHKVRRYARLVVDVKVFMIGGMIEERLLADMKKAYDSGAVYTNRYIKEKGL